MRKLFYLLSTIALMSWFYSCTEDNIGSSLSGSTVEIIGDSSFTISGYSVENTNVPSRTITQLLGVISAENYGDLTSDFVSQMMPTVAVDTTYVTADRIDSCFFIFRFPVGGFTGDSLVPMRASVYKLNKQLPASISSSFDPKEYYDKSDLLGASSYTGTQIYDTISGYREIRVKTDRKLAVDIFNRFKQDPSMFRDPNVFAQYFPGIYVSTSFGNGRVVNIYDTEFRVHYRKIYEVESGDTTVFSAMSYLAASEEVTVNNNINLSVADNVKNMVAAGDAIIQTPASYEVRLNIPVQEIIDKYLDNGNSLTVFNNVSLTIPAEAIESESGINPPQYLLLLPTAQKDEFLASNNKPDNESSFYAQYNSSTHSYTFSQMRNYFINIMQDKNGVAAPEDSDFTLTPVDPVFDSNDYLSSYYYYYSSYYSTQQTLIDVKPAVDTPSIVKLLLDDAKISVYYSKLSGNN